MSTINEKITSYGVVFRWGQKGEWAWCGCLDSMVTGQYGTFEKVSYGGRVLMNASAMIPEREALRMGIEH